MVESVIDRLLRWLHSDLGGSLPHEIDPHLTPPSECGVTHSECCPVVACGNDLRLHCHVVVPVLSFSPQVEKDSRPTAKRDFICRRQATRWQTGRMVRVNRDQVDATSSYSHHHSTWCTILSSNPRWRRLTGKGQRRQRWCYRGCIVIMVHGQLQEVQTCCVAMMHRVRSTSNLGESISSRYTRRDVERSRPEPRRVCFR
jgi:hypothetical protein